MPQISNLQQHIGDLFNTHTSGTVDASSVSGFSIAVGLRSQGKEAVSTRKLSKAFPASSFTNH